MATHRVIQAALLSAVDDGVFPGAQLAVRLRGELQCVIVAGQLSSEGWYWLPPAFLQRTESGPIHRSPVLTQRYKKG